MPAPWRWTVPNVQRFTRVEGDDLAHLVWTMHGEGSTDGYSYGLCSAYAPYETPRALAPYETPDEVPEGEPAPEAAPVEVCDKCARLARGEQLPPEPYDLGPNEISAEEMARRFAEDADEPETVPESAEESENGHTVRPLPNGNS
jgi:hypothetical protein